MGGSGCPEPLDAGLDDVGNVDEVVLVVLDGLIVVPGQPEQVLDDPAQPRALPTHPFEHVPVSGGITRSIESQLYLGLNDRDRRA